MADTKIKKIRQMFLTRGPTYVEGEDISDILQSELDDYREINIPAGYYYNYEALTTPYRSGGALKGAGRTDVLISASSTKSGLSTRIRCLSNALTGAALTIQGSEFELRNITLLGATTHPTIPPAQASGIGVQIANTGGTGLGSSKSDIHGCGLYGWTTGVKFGSTDAGYSNDHTNLSRCTFRNNTNCIWIRNTQAMGTAVDTCQFRHENAYAIRVSGGGHVTSHNCLVTHGQSYFYFDGTNASGSPTFLYRTGPNNRLFSVYDLKVDDQHAGDFKFVETTHRNQAQISFIRPQVSGGDAWSMGNIDEHMTLSIIDPSFNTTPTDFTVSDLTD